mmetsp:Transcript_39304/g.45234  ORF Transcript_39304/g.45234 Transcript_39304/m.45234 type:complete len:99 (-) Transcript_39304:312-608(-)
MSTAVGTVVGDFVPHTQDNRTRGCCPPKQIWSDRDTIRHKKTLEDTGTNIGWVRYVGACVGFVWSPRGGNTRENQFHSVRFDVCPFSDDFVGFYIGMT